MAFRVVAALAVSNTSRLLAPFVAPTSITYEAGGDPDGATRASVTFDRLRFYRTSAAGAPGAPEQPAPTATVTSLDRGPVVAKPAEAERTRT